MRSLGSAAGAAVLAASLVISCAFAATTPDTPAPLAPGKPAGVKQAQMEGSWGFWLGAAAVVGLGIGLVASGNGNKGTTTTTTTSTSP